MKLFMLVLTKQVESRPIVSKLVVLSRQVESLEVLSRQVEALVFQSRQVEFPGCCLDWKGPDNFLHDELGHFSLLYK